MSADLPIRPRLHIVLVAPQIPPNTGTLARTALAVGGRLHLVRPLGFRADERTARRAGLDYWDRADVRIHADFNAWRGSEPEAAASAWYFSRHARRCYWDARFREEDALVFGSETKGLPPSVLESAPENRRLALPQEPDTVRSLNLACAGTAAIYEALRQIGWRGNLAPNDANDGA